MTKTVSELNRALRSSRKASGKVELRLWVSPQTKVDLAAIGQENGKIDLAGALTLLVWLNRQAERMRDA